MSVIFRHAVFLAVAAVVIGACSYRAGDTCDGDVCVNHAPIAVISGVASDGALRVGGAGEVLISARQSSDPDGDVLTFTWTASAPCDVAVVSDLNSQELRLDNLAVGSTCEVGLVVSDGRGLFASASAMLVVRDVGGFVTVNTLQCVATFDPDSDAPQGTPATPFCSVAQGLVAARTFHLAEVSLEAGLHGLAGPVTIDFPVRITGGYTRSATAWPIASGSRSTLELRQPTGSFADAELVASGGVILELHNLTVRRSGACRAACALVRANRASVELLTVTLGAEEVTTIPSANDAPGRTYASLQLDALDEPTHHLIAENLAIFGSANAAVSYGILVKGPAAVQVTGLTVYERAQVSAGVRTSRAGAVSIAGATFDIQPPTAVGSRGYAVLDGERATVSLGSCPPTVAVCDGSESLTVTDSDIVVNGADQVFGVAALGTGQVAVTGGSITVNGQQAWGVLTTAVRGATLDELVTDVTTRRFRGSIEAFGVGYSDNFDDSNADAAGSETISVTRAQIDVHIAGDSITQAAGVNLVRSSTVNLDGAFIRVTGESHLASIVNEVAGIRLLTTQNVSVANGSIEVSALRAVEGIVGIADGEVIVDGLPVRVGSQNVTVSGVEVLTAVQADLVATAACLLFVDTRTARIAGGNGASMTCGASGPATSFGIFTSAGQDIEIHDVDLLVQSAPGIAGLNDSTLIGIHDGGITASEIGRASSKLVVTGNRVIVDQSNRKAIGVRIRGRADTDPLVDDNFVMIRSSFKNIGVLLQSTQATVALNSIRLSGCDTLCTGGGYAIGVYVMHAQTLETKILGNALSVFTVAAPGSIPAIVRHSSSFGDVDSDVGTVTGNVYGNEVDGTIGPFVAAAGDPSTNILLPTSMTAYAAVDVAGAGNQELAPIYCADGIHSSPAGPQRGAAEVIAQTFGVDIDGEQRSVTGLDAGADRIGSGCP